MAYTFEELKHKKVSELREMAKGIEHEAVKGFSQLNKEHLLQAICSALSIDMHAHHEVVGVNKGKLRAQIRELRAKRDEALAAGKKKEQREYRVQIRKLKRTLRKATV